MVEPYVFNEIFFCKDTLILSRIRCCHIYGVENLQYLHLFDQSLIMSSLLDFLCIHVAVMILEASFKIKIFFYSSHLISVIPFTSKFNDLLWMCAGWGTNEDLIISILSHRNSHQRKLIRQAYAETYGEDLLKSLDKELSSDFEVRFCCLVYTFN